MIPLGAILSFLTGPILDKIFSAIEMSQKIKLDREKIRAELQTQLATTDADLVKGMYESFQATVRSSPIMQRYIAAVGVSQLAVLIWYQLGVPFLIYYGLGPWPSPGTTVDWAYAIIAGTTGVALVDKMRR